MKNKNFINDLENNKVEQKGFAPPKQANYSCFLES